MGGQHGILVFISTALIISFEGSLFVRSSQKHNSSFVDEILEIVAAI